MSVKRSDQIELEVAAIFNGRALTYPSGSIRIDIGVGSYNRWNLQDAYMSSEFWPVTFRDVVPMDATLWASATVELFTSNGVPVIMRRPIVFPLFNAEYPTIIQQYPPVDVVFESSRERRWMPTTREIEENANPFHDFGVFGLAIRKVPDYS